MRRLLLVGILALVGCDGGGPSAPSRTPVVPPTSPPVTPPTITFTDCVVIPGTPPKDPVVDCEIDFVR
jgi:hypothetical protein